MRSFALMSAVAMTGLLLSSDVLASITCKNVAINSQILIDGQPKAGIRMKVGAENEIAADALGIDWGGASGTTNAQGRFVVTMRYCGFNATFGINPKMIFRFRSEFNTDSKIVDGNYNYSGTINFNGNGAKNYIPPRPQSKIKFRFPVADPLLYNNHKYLPGIAKHALDLIYSGPFHVDHRSPVSPGSLSCENYNGEGGLVGFPHCYGGHRGTDIMLLGSFGQMDKPGANLVVAAADGVIESISDGGYDRCHAELVGGDGYSSRISCDGQLTGQGGNNLVVRHNFDKPGDPAYDIRTTYYHVKKHSASSRWNVGDFVRCGDVIAEIGSSGISSQPHLHFQVKHAGLDQTDPYQGKYSYQSYWTNQYGGPRGFPSTQCQNPAERYSYQGGNFDASIIVAQAPQDLGVRTTSPVPGGLSGAARWYKIRIKTNSIAGFSDLAKVRYRFPQEAVAVNAGDKINQEFDVYMPVAPARVATLNHYDSTFSAEISQNKGVASPVLRNRSVVIHLPRPNATIKTGAGVVSEDASCPTKLRYQLPVSSAQTGFYGAVNTTWRTSLTTGQVLTSLPTPLSLCGGHGAVVQATVTDNFGAERDVETLSVATPTLVAPISASYGSANVRSVAFPEGGMLHQLTSSKEGRIYSEVRLVVAPTEDNNSLFPKAPNKGGMTIAWSDLKFRDSRTGQWTPIAAGTVVNTSLATTKVANDTLVFTFTQLDYATQFAAAVSVVDGYGRKAVNTFYGANGESKIPVDPKRLPHLEKVLQASGFGGIKPQPCLSCPVDPTRDRFSSDPPPDAFFGLAAKDTLTKRNDVKAVATLRAEVSSFAAKLDAATRNQTLHQLSANSLPKFSVQATKPELLQRNLQLMQVNLAKPLQLNVQPSTILVPNTLAPSMKTNLLLRR